MRVDSASASSEFMALSIHAGARCIVRTTAYNYVFMDPFAELAWSLREAASRAGLAQNSSAAQRQATWHVQSRCDGVTLVVRDTGEVYRYVRCRRTAVAAHWMRQASYVLFIISIRPTFAG